MSQLSNHDQKRKSSESPEGSNLNLKRQNSHSFVAIDNECDNIDISESVDTDSSIPTPTQPTFSADMGDEMPLESEPTENKNIMFEIVTSPEFANNLIPALTRVMESILPAIVEAKLEETIAAVVDKSLLQYSEQMQKLSDISIAQQNQISDQSKIIQNLNQKISQLETRLEDFDQYSRRNCLRFNNIPVELHKEKSPDEIVIDICQKIGANIKKEDIARAHPLGIPQNGKVNYIARFLSYRQRAVVFGNKKKLKNIPGNIYISEHLTPYRQSLMKHLWEMRNRRLITAYWTYDGRIFAKIGETTPKIIIKDESSINQLKLKLQ